MTGVLPSLCERVPTVVLVGTSGYGRRHLADLLAWHNAGLISLVGLVDLEFTDEVRQLVLACSPPPRLAGQVGSFLEGGGADVDTVVVATPPHTHFAIASTVLRSGASLYLEKPPVPLLQQLDALSLLAGSGSPVPRRFEIGFQESGRIVDTVGAVVASGSLGEVRRITAHAALARPDSYYTRNNWAGQWFRNGQAVLDGPLFNPLAHIVHSSLMIALQAEPAWAPRRVTSEFLSLRAIAGDDIAAFRVESAVGPVVVAVGTTAADAVQEPSITVLGTRGSLTIRHRDALCTLVVDGEATVVAPVAARPLALLGAVTDPRGPADVLIDVAAVRPFVTVLNAAVQAAQSPRAIPEWQEFEERDGEKVRMLPGLTAAISTVVETGSLFSELGYEWAAAQSSIEMAGYRGLEHPQLIDGDWTTP